MLNSGDVIGRYHIQRRLGHGGMGTLFVASDPSIDRLVAIKLLKDGYQDDPELRERFIREARSLARLRHENIITIFDIGEADGVPFIVMEYIVGETVAQVLGDSPSPPLVKRLTMLEEFVRRPGSTRTAPASFTGTSNRRI